MITSLTNDRLSIAVKAHGAELCSLQSLKSDRQYLWQADPQVWAKHSPLLFPFIGRLNQGRYRYQGKTYLMDKHGFARDSDFTLIQQSRDCLTYELTDSPETRRNYPFEFSFRVTYQLIGNKVVIAFSVHNRGNAAMYFSLGGHPALSCQWQPGDQLSDYVLDFETSHDAQVLPLINGLIGPVSPNFNQGSAILPLSDKLFAQDALILARHGLKRVLLKRLRNDDAKVVVEFAEFPYLGIWSKPGPFVCIEPWFGLDDLVDFTGKLPEKAGIESLMPDEEFTAQYAITIME